eukprot:gene7672-9178_t
MSESSKLLSVETEETQGNFLDVGQMYIFHPARHYSKLTLCKTQSTADPSVHIKRPAVFVVIERKGTWRNVSCSGHQGWINVSDGQEGSKVFEKVSTFRRYQDWRGNNLFFSEGRVMLGSDGKFFMATNGVASIVIYLFYAYVVPGVPDYANIVKAVGTLLWVVAVVNLWLVAFIEPGIIPRLPPHVKPSAPSTGITTVGWKYCKICNILRPPQVKHCKACQNCVHGFDHHCPYTSNCIGVRNRQYFLIFVICLNAFLMLLFGCNAWILALSVKAQQSGVLVRDLEQAFVQNSVVFVVGLASMLSLFLFLPFCKYHLYITAIGETTFEHIKRIYADTPNPNDHGVCGNYALLCCSAKQASLVPDMHEEVTAEQYLKENADPAVFNNLFYSNYGSAFEDVSPPTMAGTENI